MPSDLRKAGRPRQPSPGKRIWSLLDEEHEDQRWRSSNDRDDDERRRERDAGEFFRVAEALRKGLNKLLAQRDFYREDGLEGRFAAQGGQGLSGPAARIRCRPKNRLG